MCWIADAIDVVDAMLMDVGLKDGMAAAARHLASDIAGTMRARITP
jgi:hypothetical protein